MIYSRLIGHRRAGCGLRDAACRQFTGESVAGGWAGWPSRTANGMRAASTSTRPAPKPASWPRPTTSTTVSPSVLGPARTRLRLARRLEYPQCRQPGLGQAANSVQLQLTTTTMLVPFLALKTSCSSSVRGAFGLALTILVCVPAWPLEARADDATIPPNPPTFAALQDFLASGDGNQRHAAVGELGKLRTTEARETLRRAALGEYGKELASWATTCFLNSLDDKSQARVLLASQSTYVVCHVLGHMNGVAVDAGLWKELRPLLESKNYDVRRNCVVLLQLDTAGFDPVAKVGTLLASLTSAAKLPAAQEPSRFTHKEDTGHTELDDFFFAVTRALASAKGVTVEVLRDLTPAENRLAREAAIIARRWTGDREVASEFRQVMEHGMVAGSRIEAIRVVNALGSPDPADLEVLRRVAAGDTNSFIPGQRYRGHKPEPRFQVREAATWVLDELARREGAAQ